MLEATSINAKILFQWGGGVYRTSPHSNVASARSEWDKQNCRYMQCILCMFAAGLVWERVADNCGSTLTKIERWRDKPFTHHLHGIFKFKSRQGRTQDKPLEKIFQKCLIDNLLILGNCYRNDKATKFLMDLKKGKDLDKVIHRNVFSGCRNVFSTKFLLKTI